MQYTIKTRLTVTGTERLADSAGEKITLAATNDTTDGAFKASGKLDLIVTDPQLANLYKAGDTFTAIFTPQQLGNQDARRDANANARDTQDNQREVSAR